jgi:trigger factor
MIEGFEDGIIGMKKGETKTLHLTFPSDYHATELAGRAVDFDVTVHTISTTTAGEFTDDVANEISVGQYTTAAEYTDYLLKEEKLAAVQEKLYALASFKETPNKEIEKEYETYLTNYKMMALNNGQTLEDYIYASYQQDLATFLKMTAQEAANSVKQKMTIYYVLQLEGKSVTGEVYDAMAEDLFGEYLETYESYYGKEYVENTIAVRYACQLVLDQIG